MRLIATWTKDQDVGTELPSSLKWEDGTVATLDDYEKHQLDTHSLHAHDDGGMECHMFGDIVAEVTFDRYAQDWVVTGPDIASVGLELHDPNAKDEQIIAELYTFPLVYRADIIR
jgi:hypothetical protein